MVESKSEGIPWPWILSQFHSFSWSSWSEWLAPQCPSTLVLLHGPESQSNGISWPWIEPHNHDPKEILFFLSCLLKYFAIVTKVTIMKRKRKATLTNKRTMCQVYQSEKIQMSRLENINLSDGSAANAPEGWLLALLWAMYQVHRFPILSHFKGPMTLITHACLLALIL